MSEGNEAEDPESSARTADEDEGDGVPRRDPRLPLGFDANREAGMPPCLLARLLRGAPAPATPTLAEVPLHALTSMSPTQLRLLPLPLPACALVLAEHKRFYERLRFCPFLPSR